MSQKKFSTTELLHAIREIPKSLITSGEKLVLVTLLACMNAENETWYGSETMAAFSSLAVSTFKKHLYAIEKKKFIIVERPIHSTHNCTNHYHLNLDLILSFHVNSSRPDSVCDLSTGKKVASVFRMPSRPDSVCHRVRIPDTKKDIKKERKKERAGKELSAPLSDDFQPTRETKDVIYKLGYTKEDMINEFNGFAYYYYGVIDTYKGWDLKFRRWMKQKHKHEMKNQPFPTEKTDPYKEEEMKMKRFGETVDIGKLLK